MTSATGRQAVDRAGRYLAVGRTGSDTRTIDDVMLTHRIYQLASELDHDIGRVERKRLLADIRQIRRSLVTLGSDLVSSGSASRGDAC